MKAFSSSICILAVLTGVSCNSRKSLDRDAYITWMNDAACPLLNEKKVGEYTFVAQHRPADLVTLQEFKPTEEEISRAQFDSVKKEFDGMQYYMLKIKTSDAANDMLSFGIASQQEYYDRIQYFSTTARQDIYLVDDGDTIPCGLYHFERTYGVSPYNHLMLGFEKRSGECKQAKQLHFNDRMLGNGMLIFSFPARTMNDIPELIL